MGCHARCPTAEGTGKANVKIQEEAKDGTICGRKAWSNRQLTSYIIIFR